MTPAQRRTFLDKAVRAGIKAMSTGDRAGVAWAREALAGERDGLIEYSISVLVTGDEPQPADQRQTAREVLELLVPGWRARLPSTLLAEMLDQ
jgi:hypothetical protein